MAASNSINRTIVVTHPVRGFGIVGKLGTSCFTLCQIGEIENNYYSTFETYIT